MGRLNALVNLIILAIAAFIIWREITQPRRAPATPSPPRPRPAPTPPSTSRRPDPAPGPLSGAAAGSVAATEADTGITGVVSTVAGMAEPTMADDATPPPGEPATVSGATEAVAGDHGAAGVGETVAPLPDAESDAAATGVTADAVSKAAPAAPQVPADAVRGDGTNVCPDDHPIKGNAASMIYHAPGRASYDRTIPEYCFASVEAAEAAGYRAPKH